MADDNARVWTYRYDTNNNLEFVDNPDGTTKQYHYEDVNFPNALTGITDERGLRFATWAYDSQGRAILSTHANNAERVDIVYSPDGTRTVTDSRGFISLYGTTTLNGVALVSDVTGPGCASCGDGNTSNTYDPANNNLLSKTENGLTTAFANYDTNGNPGTMTEAFGTANARTTDYSYDPRFRSKVTLKTEPSVCATGNKATATAYDAFGNATGITVAGFTPNCTAVSRTTTFQYNGPLNQLTQIDGPRTDASDLTTFTYYPNDATQGDNRGRLQRVVGPTGIMLRDNIQYTATGKVLSETRPNGLTLSFTYYAGNDRLQTLTENDGSQSRVTRWTYLATGEVQTITQADGTPAATTLTFAYDDARRLTKITDGLGNFIQYTLDTEGNRISENTFDSTNTLKKALTQTFDVYNRLDTTAQVNEAANLDFAADGTLTTQTDGKGAITDYSYDALKRLATITQDVGGTNTQTQNALTQYGYDVADRLTTVTDPANGNTTFSYDDVGNLITTTSPDTGTTTSGYDAAGNVITQTDAKGQVFAYTYDALNRVTTIDAPGTTDDISYSYDTCTGGVGRLCTATLGTETVTYAYNGFGDITAHQGMTYTYDAAARIQTMTYPSGAIVTYQYDSAGQINQVTLTDGTTTTTLASAITYQPFGPVKSLTYGNGKTLSQSHDTAYRVTNQTTAGALALTYPLYDANGNLLTRDNALTTTRETFTYDALNRLGTAAGTVGPRTYVYDKNGNRQSLDDGTTTNYTYTANTNRLTQINTTALTLDANGNTTAQGARTFSYNAYNRLIGVTDNTTQIASYTYNALGQRASKITATTTRFTYGLNGELLMESDGTGSPQVEYIDLNGQPLAMRTLGTVAAQPPTEVIVDNTDAATSLTGTWGTHAFGSPYQTNFRQANAGSGGTFRFTPTLTAGTYAVYGWWNINTNNSGAVPYTIRASGTDTVVTVNQKHNGGQWNLLGTFTFTGDGSEYIQIAEAGKTVADAVRFVPTGAPPPPSTQTTLYYIHTDHLGTPKALTDPTGTVVWTAIHDPFGLATVNEDPDNDTNTVTFNLRFPGQYYDSETGLHYNLNRYYSPKEGRYITSDPIGLEGGLNTYLYAEANPIGIFDPMGLTGNSAQRRKARRKNRRPPPVNMNKDERFESFVDDLPVGTKGILCALQIGGCLPKDLFVCSKLLCIPECGKPFIIDLPLDEPILMKTDTPCKCIEKKINRNFDEPLPGL